MVTFFPDTRLRGKIKKNKRLFEHLRGIDLDIDDESMLSFVCFGQLHMKLQSSTILLFFSWEVSNPKKDHEMKPCHLFYWWTLADVANTLPLPHFFSPRFGLNWPKPSVRRCTAAGGFQAVSGECRAGFGGKAKAIAAMTSWTGWEPQEWRFKSPEDFFGCFAFWSFLTTHRTCGELYTFDIAHPFGKCEFESNFSVLQENMVW